MSYLISKLYRNITAALVAFFLLIPAILSAAPLITAPPPGEHWFAIMIDNEQVGFYRQQITAMPDGGYRIEGDGSVKMKVMGFSKETTSREVYHVSPAMALKSLEIEQTVKGSKSRLTGKYLHGGLQIRREADGKSTVRLLKSKTELIPAPALNIMPLLRDVTAGKAYRVVTFDPEEMLLKEVVVSVLGEEKSPDGQPAIKLRNTLYPFVNHDIWVDLKGNTLIESIREGLVVTKAVPTSRLAALVSGMALSKKDLIYDFSMVRAEPALKTAPARLEGLAVSIEGYAQSIPMIEDGWQSVRRYADSVQIRTGSLRQGAATGSVQQPDPATLAASDGIESDDPAVKTKALELVKSATTETEKARILAAWTADWINDSIDDGGSALKAMQGKSGNCQTHSRLYTALARAVGIPTRFVSGLVSQDGKGFLYHSWAESWLEGRWVAVDPTFNQLPADPAHLAFFSGSKTEDLAPLLGIIGKIKVKILEAK